MKKRRKRATRPPKESGILKRISKAVKTGKVRDTRHSTDQMRARDISYSEILEILTSGYHEAEKDEYKEEFQSWNYAI